MAIAGRYAANRSERQKLTAIWAGKANLQRLGKVQIAWHLYLQALRGMFLSPMTSLLTLATIAISLSLFAGFVLVLENVRDLISASEMSLSVSVYVRDDAPEANIKELADRLRREAGVTGVVFRSKEQALRDFRKSLGDRSQVLDGLEGQNPLPASYEVRFASGNSSAEYFDQFAKRFSNDAVIEDIQYSAGSIAQLKALMSAFRTGGLVAVIFMLVMTGFIISNTIRLGLFSHRDEIEIMQLVGATPGFIRAPYVLEGSVQGGIGALLGVIILFGFYSLFRDVVVGSPILSLLFPELHYLSLRTIVFIVLLGVAVGMAGSYLAVRRFIRSD
jgi:cell division transport system permease protein